MALTTRQRNIVKDGYGVDVMHQNQIVDFQQVVQLHQLQIQ